MAEPSGTMPSSRSPLVARRGGVQLWRQIADRIRDGIGRGAFGDSEMMPPEIALAERYGVNRHTVRAALKVLTEEGLVQPQQGRGTRILRRARLDYPIGKRTRFHDGLAGQVDKLEFKLVDSRTGMLSREAAEALDLEPGSGCLILETLGLADSVPLSRATHVFIPSLSGIADLFRQTGSITRSLEELGIPDYLRLSTEVVARHALAEEALELSLSPGAILIETHAINGIPGGKPIQFSKTRFPADRIKLSVRMDGS